MLTFDQIKELIELVAAHRLSGIELERSGFRLKVEGEKAATAASDGGHHPTANPGVTVSAASGSSPAALAPLAAAAETVANVVANPAAAAESEAAEPVGHILKSPIVGTFYRAPGPDKPAFAEVGDRVKKGQALCIVEAMKVMNDIESDCDGVITRIFPENDQPVEFDEPLFEIRPS